MHQQSVKWRLGLARGESLAARQVQLPTRRHGPRPLVVIEYRGTSAWTGGPILAEQPSSPSSCGWQPLGASYRSFVLFASLASAVVCLVFRHCRELGFVKETARYLGRQTKLGGGRVFPIDERPRASAGPPMESEAVAHGKSCTHPEHSEKRMVGLACTNEGSRETAAPAVTPFAGPHRYQSGRSERFAVDGRQGTEERAGYTLERHRGRHRHRLLH